MDNQTTAPAPIKTQPRYVLTSHSLAHPEAFTYRDNETGQEAEATLRELAADVAFINGLAPIEAMRLGHALANDQQNIWHHVFRWMEREGLKSATIRDWETAGSPTQQMELDDHNRTTGRDTWSDTGEVVDDRCRHCREAEKEATA